MENLKIGKYGEYPPTETISGGVVYPACDTTQLGNGYYACLDKPHHPDSPRLIAELRQTMQSTPAKPKVKQKSKVVYDED